jgi:hypothetical protein
LSLETARQKVNTVEGARICHPIRRLNPAGSILDNNDKILLRWEFRILGRPTAAGQVAKEMGGQKKGLVIDSAKEPVTIGVRADPEPDNG